eukprot:8779627-Pyramimonas_sp.AAC.2
MNSRIRVTDRLSVRDTNCPCSHVEMCILIYEPCSNPKIRTWVLQAAINACSEDERPAVLVSASALGYYGSSETSRFDETSGPGNDYLAKVCGYAVEALDELFAHNLRMSLEHQSQVCINWEKSADAAQTDRTVHSYYRRHLRATTHHTLGVNAQRVPIMQLKVSESTLVILGAGGPLGTGNQWFSWIHMDDVVGLIMEALTSPTMEVTLSTHAHTRTRHLTICYLPFAPEAVFNQFHPVTFVLVQRDHRRHLSGSYSVACPY